MTEMQIDARLAQLIVNYERATLAALRAKAEFTALSVSPTAKPGDIAVAGAHWQRLENKRAAIRHTLEELEDRSAA